MGVASFLVLFLGFGFIVFLAFYSEYKRVIKRHKPEYFGLDIFQQVTLWQTSEWQDQAKKNGLTIAEWQYLCDQQLNWVESAIDSRIVMRGSMADSTQFSC